MQSDIYNQQCDLKEDWIDVYIDGKVCKAIMKCPDGCWNGTEEC